MTAQGFGNRYFFKICIHTGFPQIHQIAFQISHILSFHFFIILWWKRCYDKGAATEAAPSKFRYYAAPSVFSDWAADRRTAAETNAVT